MHPKRILTLIVLIASSLFLAAAAGDPPPTPAPPEIEAELASAFDQRLQVGQGTQTLTFDLFTPELDAAFTSPDGTSAVLWLALREDNGSLLATEPGLVLARRSDTGWQVLLPGDDGWDETLAALPAGMLPLEQSPAPAGIDLNAGSLNAPLTGYYLPYAAGTSHWLEGSISHFQSVPELGYPSCAIEYCHYAYDFTDTDHFPLVASKEGTLFASRDTCSDGSPNCTNFIVLRTASEATYQIYLHLAHGTIPDHLTVGDTVKRGQYLGDSDDTGYSTSQHVHFMVTNNIWMGNSDYYWGNSIDVRFADVAINNGIPRNCYEVTRFQIYDGATECLGNKADPRNPANDWFVSGNVGAYPATGALTVPAAGATVASGNTTVMDVTATASDDVRVAAVRLVTKINGQWVEIGPQVTQPVQTGRYTWDVDLCATAPVNGPLEVALRVWDHEGNVSAALSPRTIQVDHACPAPTSQLKPAVSFDSTAVRLDWDANSSGAGLGSFELQWRIQSGTWSSANTLSAAGSQRSVWFSGQPGTTYEFRLRAFDTNGQAEAWPAADAAETSATLPATCSPDAFEEDDASAQAKALALGVPAQRNLCASADPDWFQVDIPAADIYSVSALSQNGGAAVRISVYAANGTTLVASSAAAGVGQNTSVLFHPSAGRYTIKVEPLSANLFGTQAVYAVEIAEARVIYMPVIAR